ncbi:MAG: UDP-N-acetylmuramoylalanyl-D-glutamyl-2,6-diaminopimelate--D-alanyl-D-alanine ligase [Rhodospirillaceae bacterium]|jgi:UDP-N-acetylmuramoyl-tripeptide--D-alanyl-D-alanine ligase|nr:UDP-N-acetylmuramoylalanyl-D-glutamyl-2,6-diaminopimelate--D-alanyl-D-alanine ligase [Rhodospirillaceae bacterium]MBT5458994.1 UDP-N-acetylmuramoylalanyl-D-glutamyl-2,6-diaminopimelate--D-alanyl-D-alanine ligase [Rhodospirillaceae bacterium]
MTAPLWSETSAVEATGGHAVGTWSAQGVSIDSRSIAPDDLFVAIEGPRLDGHDFVATAMKSGAAAALISRRPDDIDADTPSLEVPDTLEALRALAVAARARTEARIIAVTGSVGKTSTKEALRLALENQGKTTASASSFNNHWGVPLSVARMPGDTDFGVFEVGMNHAGEIEPLSKIIRPHVAVITTIEPAHIEFFDSIEGIADAKAEIFTGMSGGTAILNRDNPLFERLATAARDSGIDTILSFGQHADADARLVSHATDRNGSNVEADIAGRRIGYRLSMPGKHFVMNSLAVLAAISAVGGKVATAARTLEALVPLDGRGRRHEIAFKDDSFTLIDESYNANPASMRAAFEALAMTRPGPNGRRIVALGEMRELGGRSATFHRELADEIQARGIDMVFACGPRMADMYGDLPRALQGGFAEDSTGLAGKVCSTVRGGDVVVVKGSLASGMKKVVDALMALRSAAANAVNG